MDGHPPVGAGADRPCVMAAPDVPVQPEPVAWRDDMVVSQHLGMVQQWVFTPDDPPKDGA